jgi:membrane associated rhomboid family serine protease
VVTFLGLLVFVGLILSAMAPEVRERLREMALGAIERARREATRSRPAAEEFREALGARTRWAPVTPVLIAVNVIVFILMVLDAGAPGDPAALAGWGGNVWLRTRNGEWWRLVTSMFVHAGTFHLLVNVAGLAQIGLILERLVGRLIVAAVFLMAGVLASLVHLTTHPMGASAGASGAVFGLYGLLLAASIWGMRHRSDVRIPLIAAKRLAPAAAVFIVYNLANDSVGGAAELTGFLAGLVCGAVLARGVSDRKPAARRVAHLTAAAAVAAVIFAVPLRGVTDVEPELERAVAAEDRMAGEYRQAADRFSSDKMTAEALALLIDRTIIFELGVTGARLEALAGAPEEHQRLVAHAEEYVRLRSESWRLRSEWLRKAGIAPRQGAEAAQYRANNRTIARAEETERAALEALDRSRPVRQQ